MGRQRKRNAFRDPAQTRAEQLSLEIVQRPELENPMLAGSLRLKGEIPVRRDLNPGDQITVTVADADGTIFATGLFEATVPAWKEIRLAQVGPVGLERVNIAEYDEEG
jgi:hypothetical protein